MKLSFLVGNDDAEGEDEVDITLVEDHEHPGQYALRYLKTLAA